MEDTMNKAHTMTQQLKRLVASCGLAAVMFAGGFSLERAHAEDADTSFQGIVITPASASASDAEIRPAMPQFKRGKVVPFGMNKPAGTIVVNTRKNVLYYVLGNGKAVQFRVATAKPGFGWSGTHKVSGKVQWPDWRPPVEMRKRRPDLPAFMAGGPKNPLGARALVCLQTASGDGGRAGGRRLLFLPVCRDLFAVRGGLFLRSGLLLRIFLSLLFGRPGLFLCRGGFCFLLLGGFFCLRLRFGFRLGLFRFPGLLFLSRLRCGFLFLPRLGGRGANHEKCHQQCRQAAD